MNELVLINFGRGLDSYQRIPHAVTIIPCLFDVEWLLDGALPVADAMNRNVHASQMHHLQRPTSAVWRRNHQDTLSPPPDVTHRYKKIAIITFPNGKFGLFEISEAQRLLSIQSRSQQHAIMNPYAQTTYTTTSYPPVQTVIAPPIGVQPTVLGLTPTTTLLPAVTQTTQHIPQAGMQTAVVPPAGIAPQPGVPHAFGAANPGYAAPPGAYPAVKLHGKHGYKGKEYDQPGFVRVKGGKNTKHGHKGLKARGMKHR
ncbi:hypothetical protein PROFUN_08560 [Planoprotostelium fungivorum]|uniref:Uncharacterized protein n=1 Tax=Planoprotostelium fungivorum TaxID=1890364 RepID=A0A2P6N1P1_9EUKA|nr:hypothetical protein PROFUN_08560 [Planoprotostelium fungivorum]